MLIVACWFLVVRVAGGGMSEVVDQVNEVATFKQEIKKHHKPVGAKQPDGGGDALYH